MNRIGIDLGGTKIEGIVLDESGNELFRKRIPTEQENGYDHILQNIKTLYSELTDHSQGTEHTLGIGTPGAVSSRTGQLKNSNTECLNGMPFKDDLEKKIGRPFRIYNDANCFAMAEALFGAGKGKDVVFGVIMGTGCGGGIVYHESVVNGLQDIGGEWGHMSIDPDGPDCYCGNKGCVETFISGGGMERMFREKHGSEKKLADIVGAFRSGDPVCTEFMAVFFRNFGRSMANLITILDPDVIVLGGGLSNIDELYTQGVEEVKRFVFSDSLETPIIKNQLGDSAGVLGAALIGV